MIFCILTDYIFTFLRQTGDFLVDWEEASRAAGFISAFTIIIIFEGLLSRILLLSLKMLGFTSPFPVSNEQNVRYPA